MVITTPWVKWFAWYPIQCELGIAWFRTVERRQRILDSYGHRFVYWEYRELYG